MNLKEFEYEVRVFLLNDKYLSDPSSQKKNLQSRLQEYLNKLKNEHQIFKFQLIQGVDHDDDLKIIVFVSFQEGEKPNKIFISMNKDEELKTYELVYKIHRS